LSFGKSGRKIADNWQFVYTHIFSERSKYYRGECKVCKAPIDMSPLLV
jgi:hypothetical protein